MFLSILETKLIFNYKIFEMFAKFEEPMNTISLNFTFLSKLSLSVDCWGRGEGGLKAVDSGRFLRR